LVRHEPYGADKGKEGLGNTPSENTSMLGHYDLAMSDEKP